MQIIDYSLSDVKISYPIDKICNPDEALFIDIETTGFTAKTSKLYLIGCAFHKDGEWKAIQFFAENYSDEKELLIEFFKFASDFKTLIHFNGNNFDIPYIVAKCKEFSLDYNFDAFDGIDIYKRISPYKAFLKLENCKQKTVEKFLKLNREDKYSGGDLIGIYHSYVSEKKPEFLTSLLLHNFEDIKGMLEILPILSYYDMFNGTLNVSKVSASYYKDEDGTESAEILMVVDLPCMIPEPISFLYDRCYFTAAAKQGMIKVPLIEEELKYFYANHEDYYYLPSEDIALHKSVASFVDKEHREQAKAANCYTRKNAKFLPEWDAMITPFFKRNYNDKTLYFELTDERRTDREMFNKYAAHVLAHMCI